jgi:hypothetical protein
MSGFRGVKLCRLGISAARLTPDIDRIEIPQRSSLLPYCAVLSFGAEAPEGAGSALTSIQNDSGPPQGLAGCCAAG